MAASFAPTPLVTTSATFWACLGYLRAQGVSDIAAVRPGDLRAFLTDDERLDRDPARPPKKHQTPPDVLALAELERLLAAPARGDILERHLVGKPECDLAPPDHPGGRPSRQARIELLNPKDTAQYGLIPITRRELTTGNTPRDETARLRRRGLAPFHGDRSLAARHEASLTSRRRIGSHRKSPVSRAFSVAGL